MPEITRDKAKTFLRTKRSSISAISGGVSSSNGRLLFDQGHLFDSGLLFDSPGDVSLVGDRAKISSLKE